ncbi:EAL domain-containing protein [methane-oxidizing endosymbiont of Gigantopelta aegis]|uniref:EAL domain-containing protein n=1 Tax=methane-oxidizing endosymbiont of Gigantopelta aegis TaxID=2794938 RepID=UPI0018DB1D06|nr:EAL domain-containing protein [methane-oxidizing endosymbiont of Gigantopelta aegis]
MLYYQPVINLNTGKIVGAESLVRWQHQDKGLIFPDQFIPVAEKMGSIEKLGEWVLQESFRQGMIWHQQKALLHK